MTAISAVVVNHDAGEALAACVASLRTQGVDDVVVVDNASTDDSLARLEKADPGVTVVRAGRNLGYGGGANLGLARVHGELVVVCNPDVVVHSGAIDVLAAALSLDESLAVVGPKIVEPDGSRYPSARRFPSPVDAVGHALAGWVMPGNRFTRRYQMADLPMAATSRVDWVSGAFFLARRSALESVGGFDERFWMYLEDTDLCWRLRRARYEVAYVPSATVSHVQGLSTARRPYRMLVAHHRSAFRFASRTTSGWARLSLPVVGLMLAVRLVVMSARLALSSRRPSKGAGAPG